MIKIAKCCNLIAYPLLWLLVVTSAGKDIAWAGSLGVSIYLLIHTSFFVLRDKMVYIVLLGATFTYGFIIESIFKTSGALMYASDSTSSWVFPPLWVVFLYPLFTVTCSLFFGFLKKRIYISSLLGFFMGPLTYYNAYRLGAASFPLGILKGSVIVGLLWALSFPLIIQFSTSNTWYETKN